MLNLVLSRDCEKSLINIVMSTLRLHMEEKETQLS
jgi:hypothetical protein